MKGMGMYYSGWVAKNRPESEGSAEVPHFLSFKGLKPFVERHLGDLQSIILKYRTATGQIAHGIRAEIIPKISRSQFEPSLSVKHCIREGLAHFAVAVVTVPFAAHELINRVVECSRPAPVIALREYAWCAHAARLCLLSSRSLAKHRTHFTRPRCAFLAEHCKQMPCFLCFVRLARA